MSEAKRDIKRKLQMLRHLKERGNVAKTCRHFGIARQKFHDWEVRYEKFSHEGLINHKPCPENLSLRVAPGI